MAASVMVLGATYNAAMKIVDECFTVYESGKPSKMDALASALVSLRYYGRFMDEVEGKE